LAFGLVGKYFAEVSQETFNIFITIDDNTGNLIYAYAEF